MSKNIFESIRDREIFADIVYSNKYITAFKDIDPCAPIHIIIIPNKKFTNLDEVSEKDSIYLSEILFAANIIAKQLNIHNSGYRLINNCNKDGGQEIKYLHFHLVGGLPLGRMIGLSKENKKKFKILKDTPVTVL